VQAVGILVGVHRRRGRHGVEPLRQRQLDDVAGARRVGVELGDDVEDVLCDADAGSSRLMLVMPTSAQSRCLPAT
jgi:hypothetical protein